MCVAKGRFPMSERSRTMRIVTVASHGIICLMMMIALMGSAFAEAGLNRTDVQAKKESQAEESRACPTPGTDKSLEWLRKRYVELVLESTTEFSNELAVVRKAETTGTLKQRLMRFSCALECQKERLYVSSSLQRRFKRRWWRLNEMSLKRNPSQSKYQNQERTKCDEQDDVNTRS